LEILCHPHESRNKAGILPNKVGLLPDKVGLLPDKVGLLPDKATVTQAPDPAGRIPKTFRRTPMNTRVVTEAKADLRVPAPTSARLPRKPEHLPAQ
jgi:hypothetical protein